MIQSYLFALKKSTRKVEKKKTEKDELQTNKKKLNETVRIFYFCETFVSCSALGRVLPAG